MAKMSKTQLLVVVLGLIGSSQAFITGCSTYVTPAPATGEACQTCATGFVSVNGGKQCNSCPIGCTDCDANNNCIKCSMGSFAYQGQCLSCITGCEQCSSGSNSCTKCAPEFTLMAGQCLACIDNCASCSQAGVCTKCNDMYLLTKNTLGQERCVYNDYGGLSPGIVVWIVVLFLLCCAPLALVCFFMFKPAQSQAESSGYAPLTQQQPKQPAANTQSPPANTNQPRSPPMNQQGSPMNQQNFPVNQQYTPFSPMNQPNMNASPFGSPRPVTSPMNGSPGFSAQPAFNPARANPMTGTR